MARISAGSFQERKAWRGEIKAALISSLPFCQETATFCVSKLTQRQEQEKHKVEIQVFSFHFQGKTEGYTTAISGIKRNF